MHISSTRNIPGIVFRLLDSLLIYKLSLLIQIIIINLKVNQYPKLIKYKVIMNIHCEKLYLHLATKRSTIALIFCLSERGSLVFRI